MPKLKANCINCDKSFEYYLSVRKTAKYCSKKCQFIGTKNLSKSRFLWEEASYEQKIKRLKKMFDKHVTPIEGCWFWDGIKEGLRASLNFDNHAITANRASWLIFKGEIGKGLYVCHTCDEIRCVNPDHLFLGTPKDNFHDMINKGRKSKRFMVGRFKKP